MRSLPIATSYASTKTWNGLFQSGGWTTGSWDNRIFSEQKAFSFSSIHVNGSLCTTSRSGVAESANYRIIRLCHLIWPNNLLSAFALVGAGASRMALTLSGSIAIPSLLTIFLRSLLLVTTKAHLAGLRLSLASLHFCRYSKICCRWSEVSPNTAKSSRNTSIKLGVYTGSMDSPSLGSDSIIINHMSNSVEGRTQNAESLGDDLESPDFAGLAPYS